MRLGAFVVCPLLRSLRVTYPPRHSSLTLLCLATAAFGEVLEAALEAADGIADESTSPLSLEQLQGLATQLAALSAAHLVPRVQGELLTRLLDVLDVCISRGLGADLGPHAVATTTADAFSRSLTSLEAACCTLQVLCSRGVSPQSASQERVAQLIDLVKGQLSRNVLTWYDPHRRRAAAAQAGGGAPAGQGAASPVAPPSTTPRKRRKTGKHALSAVALSDGEGEASDGEADPDPDADETDGIPLEADDDDEGIAVTPKRGAGGRSVTPKGKGRAAAAGDVPIDPVPASVKRVLDRLCGGHGGGLLAQVGALAACTCLHDAAVVASKDCAMWAMEPPLGGGGPAAAVQALSLLHIRGVAMLGRLFGCYPQHRGLIIDELVGAAMRMPPASRKLCRIVPVSASTDAGAGITPVAAALLTCIQSAATYPDDGTAAGNAAGRAKAGGYDDEAGGSTGGLVAPHTWSATFWTSLLGRGGAVAKNAEVDHKGVVSALLADCGTCLTSPEWPSAPLLLLAFVKQLTSGGAAAEGRVQYGLAAGEAALRSVALTWLGQVVARLRATLATHDTASSIWSVASLTRLAGGASGQGDDEAVGDLMRHGWAHIHMLQNARGSGDLFAQHMEVDLPPDALVHALQAGVDGSDAHTALLQQCTLLLLASASPEPMAVSAHRFSLAQWAADCRRVTVGADRKEVVAASDAWLKPQWMPPDGAPPPVAPPPGAIHAARQLPSRATMALTAVLLASRPLARHGDALLSKLAAGLADTSPIVRASAVKAVSLVCDADPHALEAPSLRDSIVQLLGDPSTSVRAEAVDLIGRAAARVIPPAVPATRSPGDVSNASPAAPALLEQYFEALATRVFDTGVSVRKRAMLILRDAAACPGFSRATQALARLVSRIHDEEETVQALTVKVFTSAWCDPQPAGATLDRAQQFADVAEALYTGPTGLNTALPLGPTSPLCALLARMLADGGAAVRPGLVTLAEALREKVLEAEEQHGSGDAGGATTSAPSGSRLGGVAPSGGHASAARNTAAAAASTAWHKTLPACLALHALCVADASLCCPPDDPSRLVATLAPYFVAPVQAPGGPAASGAGAALTCLLACGDAVLCWHAAQGKRLPRGLCDRLATSLVALANRATGQSLMVASVKCLCALARTEHPSGVAAQGNTPGREMASERVVQMARRSQLSLMDALATMRADGGGVDTKAASKYFAILGLLARHGSALLDAAAEAEEGEQEQQVPGAGGEAGPSPLRATSLLKLFSKYMRTADGTLQTAALRACGGVLVAHPALLLPDAAKAAGGAAASTNTRMAKVHEVALNPIANNLVKAAALQNLTDVFSQQETVLLDAQAVRVAQRSEVTPSNAGGKTPASAGRKKKAAAPSGDGGNDALVAPLSVVAGGGDSSVCGALAQHFWERVLGLMPDTCLDVRRKALACVEILIRGGLVMPMHAVPRLMAACCDDDVPTLRNAGRMLAALTDTDPMFLVTRCGEGLHAAWAFRRDLAAAADGTRQAPPETAPVRAITALGELYWRFRGVKNLRTVMVTALLRMLEDADGGGEQYQSRATPAAGEAAPPSKSLLDTLNERLSRQRFAANVLVGLPFCGVEEPASIVAALNRVISTKGAVLEGQLKAHTVAGAASGGPSPGDVAKRDAAKAMGISFCLLAKARLRLDFGLTDALMLKFNAGEGPAPTAGVDKLTQSLARVGGDQTLPLDTSCVPTAAPSTWDSLDGVASLIKRLMRDDADDFEGAQQAPQLGARKQRARKSLATKADLLSPGGDAATPGVVAEREEALAAAAASTGARRGKGRGARGGRTASAARGAKKKGGKRGRAEWSDSGEEDEGEAPPSEGDDADGDGDAHEVMPKKRLRLN